MKTGVNATKLAIAAFIVPYVFAFSPALLFDNISGVLEVVQIALTAIIGIGVIALMLFVQVLLRNKERHAMA